jgi:hypothetical protein
MSTGGNGNVERKCSVDLETPEGSVHGGRPRVSSGLQTTLRVSTSAASATKTPQTPPGGPNGSSRGRTTLDRPSQGSTSAALPAVYSAQVPPHPSPRARVVYRYGRFQVLCLVTERKQKLKRNGAGPPQPPLAAVLAFHNRQTRPGGGLNM